MNIASFHTFKPLVQKATFYFAVLVAFTIPLHKKAALVFIILFTASWLLEGNIYGRLKNIFNKKLLLMCLLFYFVHITGLFFTGSRTEGLFDLQVKLTLLLFPVFFAGAGVLFSKNLVHILFGFILGNIIAVIICLVFAVINFTSGLPYAFYYNSLSVFHHPSYFSAYLLFSIVILLYIITKKTDRRFSIVFLSYFFIGVFLIMIYLLSSKAGLLSVIIVMFLWFVIQFARQKKYLLIMVLSTTMIVLFIFIWRYNDRFRSFHSLSYPNKTDIQTTESIGVRILIWQSTWDIIKSHFLFGTGTGDEKTELMKTYNEKGMTGALQKKLNAHNQYLETFIGHGVIGFSILLFMIGYSLFFAVKSKNSLLFYFLIITAFNFLFESMLNTQAGVVFFAYFYSLFNFVKADDISSLSLFKMKV